MQPLRSWPEGGPTTTQLQQSRKTPRRLVAAGTLLAAAVVVGVAKADQALVDNDLALAGNQNVVTLSASPGTRSTRAARSS